MKAVIRRIWGEKEANKKKCYSNFLKISQNCTLHTYRTQQSYSDVQPPS